MALLAAAAGAATLVVRDPRRRVAAMVAALVLAALGIVAIVGPDRVGSVAGRRGAEVAVAVVAGLVALVAVAVLVRRRPAALPLLVVFTLPFRVPVTAGGGTANLLLPLYGVIAAGVVARLWALRDGGEVAAAPAATGNGSPPRGTTLAGRRLGRLEWALAAVVLLYALQSLYSPDREQAVKNLCFFYVPFAVMFGLLLDVRWTRRVLLGCFGVTVGLSLIFAAVGFGEWVTGRLLLANEKVLSANDLKPYFRVNSLFFDPNIYGRFLALTMLLMAAALLWTQRSRTAGLLAAGLAVLWAGLVLSLSQSSFAALLAGLALLAALRWRAWPVIALGVAAVVAAIVVVLAAPGLLHIKGDTAKALDRATAGRVDLLRGGGVLFKGQPVWGVGSGGFAESYRAREHIHSSRVVVVSHTIPVTVAAEQGVIGLLSYVALLLTGIAVLLGGLRLELRRGPPDVAAVTRAAVAAASAALLLHTLIYAAFLEDPLTWTLLAVGGALSLRARSRRRDTTAAEAGAATTPAARPAAPAAP